MASDTLPTLQRDFQVKIDDIRKRIDIQAKRKNGISQETAENEVSIFVQIPENMLTLWNVLLMPGCWKYIL